jgi:Spy/CpxP family protein refolding chaperone
MRYLIWAVLVLGGLLVPALAQDATAGGAAGRDPADLLDRVRGLTEQLDLTPDQKNQLDTIFNRAKDDFNAARAELANASQEEKTLEYRDLFSDLRQQVGAVLTADQKEQLQEKLQSLRSLAPAKDGQSQANSAEIPSTLPSIPNNPSSGGFGGRARAQGGFGPGAAGPARAGQYLERVKAALAQLNLDADQKSQVDALVAHVREQVEDVRKQVQSGTLDRPAARQKMVSLLQESREKLAGILTPEQLQQMREYMLQHGGSPGGPQGGGVGGNLTGNSPAPKVQAAANSAPPVAPAVGQPAPDFTLETLTGQKVSPSNYNHHILVLVLGSYTNPVLRDKASGLESLRNQYGSRDVDFLIVYTRETHPAGGWEIARNKTDNISIAQPATAGARESVASRAKIALHLSIPFAPDTMDDKTATAYGVGDGVPAYVIGRDGKILFHQSWLEPTALADAIDDALN